MTGEFMRRVRRLQWPVIAALALACVLVLSAGGERASEPAQTGTELETRLERVLSASEGTGKVRVMIREESRAEISAFAPQQEPSAEGVVIVCEGADDLRVRLALEQAAQALLGVPCSRIQVVKMEEGSR